MAIPSSTPAGSPDFIFPKSYSFPPFFTAQPNLSTRRAQLSKWSSLIQSYCRHHRIHVLTLSTALETPLFHNAQLHKRLSLKDAKEVVEFMASKDGDERAEWVDAAQKSQAWIWWRKPEEWGNLIYTWAVEETGQKGVVLTLYEIVEGEGMENREWAGLDGQVLQRSLATLVKKGKAQVFGSGGEQGVKFF